jgi:hypothetical protein
MEDGKIFEFLENHKSNQMWSILSSREDSLGVREGWYGYFGYFGYLIAAYDK